MDENGQPIKAEADAFGTPSTPPEAIPAEKTVVKKETEVIEGLKADIEKVKREYGSNLSGQREVIKKLEGEIAELRIGKKPDEKLEEGLFKDVKHSKDLTAEQKDEMTELEIKLLDELADVKEALNKNYIESQKDKKVAETAKVDDVNKSVREHASAIANGDTEMANQIIESFNIMKFNVDGLTPEELKQRVEVAAKQVPDYKPPREQATVHGKTVKQNGGGTDPFGTDKIVAEATQGQNGTYSL